MKTPKSDDWLIKFSGEHLFHELKMFWWLNKNVRSQTDEHMKDALLESFVLHLRNLIHFFCVPRHRDDVCAEDFFDDPAEWIRSESSHLKLARARAGKELSHLTDKRKDEGDLTKRWEVDVMFAEIKELAEKFVAKASHRKLDSKVRDLVNTSLVTAQFTLGPVSLSTGTIRHLPDLLS